MPNSKLLHPSGALVSTCMAAAAAVYTCMVLITLAHLQDVSGGMPVFDMRPTGYDMEDAQNLLAALGPAGRQYYLWRQIPLDLVYPALFGFSFFLLAIWLGVKLQAFQRSLTVCAYIAVAAAVFDYVENFLIILILRDFPNLSDTLVGAANMATVVKSGLVTVYFMGVVVVLFVWAVQVARRSGLHLGR